MRSLTHSVTSRRSISAFVNTRSDQLEVALNARSRHCERLDLRGNHFVYMRQSGGCRTTFYF